MKNKSKARDGESHALISNVPLQVSTDSGLIAHRNYSIIKSVSITKKGYFFSWRFSAFRFEPFVFVAPVHISFYLINLCSGAMSNREPCSTNISPRWGSFWMFYFAPWSGVKFWTQVKSFFRPQFKPPSGGRPRSGWGALIPKQNRLMRSPGCEPENKNPNPNRRKAINAIRSW